MGRASFPSRWRKSFTRTTHGVTVDGISPTAVAVGLVMSEYADWQTGGDVRPGHERVATVVGTSKATVKRCVAALCAAGWLVTDDRGSFGRAATYRLTVPPLANTTTGVIEPPVTGSRVTPLEQPRGVRNGVMGGHVTGSWVTPHLCQYLSRGRDRLAVAA